MRIFAWNAENHKNNIKFTAGVGEAGNMTLRGRGCLLYLHVAGALTKAKRSAQQQKQTKYLRLIMAASCSFIVTMAIKRKKREREGHEKRESATANVAYA